MIYFGNPCSPAVITAMTTGLLGLIDTPYQRKPKAVAAAHAGGAQWCADNGAFSARWDAHTWWSWLCGHPPDLIDRAVFAVAPDVVADAAATEARALPWVPRIRALGFPAAYVAQNGLTVANAGHLWEHLDALFIGGDDAYKLGPEAAALAGEARARGKWVHMGRVNSEKRWAYAAAIGCDSVDGTYLTFGADVNLPDVLAWGRRRDQLGLW